MRLRRRIIRILAFLAINVAVIGTVAEVSARLIYPIARGSGFTWAATVARLHAGFTVKDLSRGNRNRTTGVSQGTVLHPYLGRVMNPSTVVVQNGVEKRPISRLGFLGGDIEPKSSQDEIVIGISGGSVAGGFWLEGSRELRNLLNADARFAGKQIRFENFAVAGYKQPQALLTLAYLLVQGAQFDLWINLDGFNEIALPLTENIPAHVAPEFPRAWQVLAGERAAAGELQLRAERYAAMDRRERQRQRFAESIFSRSAFVVAWWDAADRRLERKIGDLDRRYRERLSGSEPSVAVQGPLFGQPLPDAAAVLRQSVEIWMNSSRAMAKLCQANGIAYFHFLQPNQYLADSKPFSEEEQRIAFAQGGYQPAAEQGYPMLVEGAKQLRVQDVPVTDLTLMFQDESRTIYEDTCCHVNALGNRLIAQRVAETILAGAER